MAGPTASSLNVPQQINNFVSLGESIAANNIIGILVALGNLGPELQADIAFAVAKYPTAVAEVQKLFAEIGSLIPAGSVGPNPLADIFAVEESESNLPG